MALAYIALGSNMGDRAAHLIAARRAVASLPDSNLVASSRVYETVPVGPICQASFYNAVIALQTPIAPMDLMEALLAIESACGRVRREKWGPRIVDLDMLLYDDLVLADESLALPHPRMHERAFVLVPLCDIAGDVKHPLLDQTMAQLHKRVDTAGIKPVPVDRW